MFQISFATEWYSHFVANSVPPVAPPKKAREKGFIEFHFEELIHPHSAGKSKAIKSSDAVERKKTPPTYAASSRIHFLAKGSGYLVAQLPRVRASVGSAGAN